MAQSTPYAAPHATATVVSIVGSASDEVLADLSHLRNVHALPLRAVDAPLASARIAASTATYVVHDTDPLVHVAAAWVEFFDDRSTLGALEVEVDEAVGAFANGTSFMPDYYVVLEPETIEGTWRHWWLGALAHAAPTRVLPVTGDASEVRSLLRRLPTGRPWPAPESWLRALQYDVPDRVGLTA